MRLVREKNLSRIKRKLTRQVREKFQSKAISASLVILLFIFFATFQQSAVAFSVYPRQKQQPFIKQGCWSSKSFGYSSLEPFLQWRRTSRCMLSTTTTQPVTNNSSAAVEHSESPVVIQEDTTGGVLESFLRKLDDSLQDDTFASFSMHGPSKKSAQNQPEKYRGSIRLLTGRLVSLKSKSKNKKQASLLSVQVTFKYHGATDIAKNWSPDVVASNLAQIIDGDTNRSPSSTASNTESSSSLLEEISSEWGHKQQYIHRARLETLDSTWELDYFVGSKQQQPRLQERRHGPNSKQSNSTLSSIKVQAQHHPHDRVKPLPLEKNAAFLQALGVTDALGQPRPGMASKLRQCQRFTEVVSGLIEKTCGNSERTTNISVVDHGCGRGYLTFSLHSYLQQQQRYSVHSKGIDVRSKLVDEMNAIVKSLNYESIHFEQGTIQDFLMSSSTKFQEEKEEVEEEEEEAGSRNSLRVMIALHACDTATDDALFAAISSETNVIVVAPCCHRQVRPQLDRHHKEHANHHDHDRHPLLDMWRHGIYRERTTEMVTDSMRALLLEIAGYTVQVFEFIDGEHTQRNCMITGIRNNTLKSKTKGGARITKAQQQEELRTRLQSLAAFHGIREQKLAQWMEESLYSDKDDLIAPGDQKPKRIPGNMPPL